MFLNTFIQKKDLFLFLATVIIKRESQLHQLLETIFHIYVNGLLVGGCRGVVEPERFFLQRIKIIRDEQSSVNHFQHPFAVLLKEPNFVGRRGIISLPFQSTPDLYTL